MSADTLLSRLEKVRRTGPGRWQARCPAHDDRHPSLALRELEDGRVLLHCFAGCEAENVLAAVGLEFDALFPPKPIGDHVKRERRPFYAHDVLACVAAEALIASIAASDLAAGKSLSDTDRERLMVAASRLGHAAEMGRAS